MVENELIQILNKQIDTDFAEEISMQALQEKLTLQINDLILNNFQRLVAILYKVDVDENKLKKNFKRKFRKRCSWNNSPSYY